jgi:hypothetical protein
MPLQAANLTPANSVSDIFISYRREDGGGDAGRLYDRLSTRFDKARIFMDIDMGLGVDFVNKIEQGVGSCKVLVAVIGRSWLEIKDNEGRRRLDDPNDWVRLEITAALEQDIPVIPALVGGARMPAASDLPGALSKLGDKPLRSATLDSIPTWTA